MYPTQSPPATRRGRRPPTPRMRHAVPPSAAAPSRRPPPPPPHTLRLGRLTSPTPCPALCNRPSSLFPLRNRPYCIGKRGYAPHASRRGASHRFVGARRRSRPRNSFSFRRRPPLSAPPPRTPRLRLLLPCPPLFFIHVHEGSAHVPGGHRGYDPHPVRARRAAAPQRGAGRPHATPLRGTIGVQGDRVVCASGGHRQAVRPGGRHQRAGRGAEAVGRDRQRHVQAQPGRLGKVRLFSERRGGVCGGGGPECARAVCGGFRSAGRLVQYRRQRLHRHHIRHLPHRRAGQVEHTRRRQPAPVGERAGAGGGRLCHVRLGDQFGVLHRRDGERVHAGPVAGRVCAHTPRHEVSAPRQHLLHQRGQLPRLERGGQGVCALDQVPRGGQRGETALAAVHRVDGGRRAPHVVVRWHLHVSGGQQEQTGQIAVFVRGGADGVFDGGGGRPGYHRQAGYFGCGAAGHSPASAGVSG
eukprot:ctg_2608.g520